MVDVLERASVLEDMLKAKGVSKYAIDVSEGEMHELNTELSNFTLYRTIFSNSASVVVYIDNKKGSASGNSLLDEDLQQLVDDACSGAESAVADEANDIAPYQEPEVFHTGPYEPDMDRFYDRMEEMLTSIEQEYPKILLMQTIGSYTKSHSVYANSNGTRFESFDGVYNVGLEFAGNDGERTTGINGASVCMHDLDTPILDLSLLRTMLSNTQDSLYVVPMGEKFEGTVIFDPNATGSFVDMLVENFMSSTVIVEGTSLWLDKVGEQVSHESVTLRLQSQDERLVVQSPVTEDGYRAQNVTLIENGVLQSHLLSLYASRKTGRPVTKNSGSCYVLEPGNTPYKELLSGVKRGLLVGWFSGGRPGVNGEFSGVAKSSFYIENGEIKGTVMETMINGNLADVFKNVTGISSELYSDGIMAFPYVRVEGITISGA
ncbi:MAG: TldD/PmbA family protein [Coriobacteriales bacterium]|nr:TldD/PmbA family protein [Coriobacteriales bacterium]